MEQIDARPRLVIATAGAEPRVMAPGKDLEQTAAYQAVAILDAWTSLYALGVDARLDLLTAWMRTVALCKPRAQGGQALILGESDPSLVQALMTWHPDLLAAAELADRAQTGLPPTVALASLWGNRQAVSWAIGQLGANLDGDMGLLEVAGEQMPSLMGPVPIAPQSNLAVKPLEGTGDRVRALVRVPVAQRDELALRLHRIISTYMASRGRSELRFCMDPKDLT
ncbi:hypothetical protein KIM372_06420 [Bombiscardovia nodaiensis]|uniref:Primosome assembly protein PriA n=1 Tax=Bombiscardovia nodaiensis TaxID=2932181 RepID=A0ABM8B7Q0_9BIFI|nr:hypothetical protein KIM372_06420 [Bombiscardovia nodaiensis]